MSKKLFIAIIAGFIIVYIARIIYVNKIANEYDIDIESYEMGTTYVDGDFSYTVRKFDVYTREELNEKYNLTIEENLAMGETIYIVSEVEVEYKGVENIITQFPFQFVSGSWSNGLEYQVYSKLNSNRAYTPGERRIVYVVSGANKAQFGTDNWKKNVYGMEFTLTMFYYPKEVRLKCY